MTNLPISGFTKNTTISKMKKQLDESLTALDNSKFFSEIREDIFATNENNVLTLNEETKNRLNALGKNVGDTIPLLEFLEMINDIIDTPKVETISISNSPQCNIDLINIPMGATMSGKSDVLSCCPSVIAAIADLESARAIRGKRKFEAEEQPLVIGNGIDLEAQTEELRNRIMEERLKKDMAAPVRIVYYMYAKKPK